MDPWSVNLTWMRPVVLTFLCENQWQYQAQDDNARTHLTRISIFCRNSVLIRHVYNLDMSMIFWTEGSTHNNGIKKPPASWSRRYSAPNHQNYSAYAKPLLVLICRWLGTHWLLKAFSSSKCDVKAITLISCDMLGNCISGFETYMLSCVYEEMLWRHFMRKMALTPR